jgi:WD40 repeat protein
MVPKIISYPLSILVVALLLGGCDDRILPADGSKNIWSGQKILFNQVDLITTFSGPINSMSLDGTTDQPPLAFGTLLCPPGAGKFLYSTVNGFNTTIHIYTETGSMPLVTGQTGEYVIEIAALSPDGSRVAYVTMDDTGTHYLNVMKSDGTQHARLNRDFGTINGILFSPDGTHIAIDSGGILNIYDLANDTLLMTIGNRSIDIPDVFGLGTFQWFQWMPDGERVIYGGYDGGSRQGIVIAPIDGGSPQFVAQDYTFPTPSPDGKRIVAIRDLNQLWIMNVDGSGADSLTSRSSTPLDFLAVPQWSSNGSKILLNRVVMIDPLEFEVNLAVEVVDVATRRRKALQSKILPAFWWE